MQKYIAVVNPRMDEDEISRLVVQDIAGALFSISHQNYPLAAKLINQVQALSRKHNRPVSIIQDVSDMKDDLDLRFGLKAGVDWVASHDPQHLKMAKGLNRHAGVILKGRNLPKDFRVDSIMSEDFVDPDAAVMGMDRGQVKHLVTPHSNQSALDSLLEIAEVAGSQGIAVSDLDLAKSLSWRRPDKKIVYAPANPNLAGRAAIYWGVIPVFAGSNLNAALQHRGLFGRGARIADARDVKHVEIKLIT